MSDRLGLSNVLRFKAVLVAASAAVALAACSSSSTSSANATSGGNQTGGTSASSSVSVATVSGVGKVLVNGSGYTLYLFTPEKGGVAACTGSCATTWPAVTVSSMSGASSMAGSGVTASDLKAIKLSNGTYELTYFGWPLHTYSGDTAAGQANGQGVGGQWFAITPTGTQAGMSSGGGSGASPSSGGSSSGGSGSWG
jgi:predicted lipoprotein with Yx(FWY)xxD motif